MPVRSPTAQGFSVMFQRPAIGIAEVTWRWCFGFAAAAGFGVAALEFLNTLPVTNGDLLFLRSRQPFLISQAAAHIFRGSAGRLLEALALLGIGLSVVWIVAGALGRAATLKGLLDHFRAPGESTIALPERIPYRHEIGSLCGLNFLRVASALAAIVGGLGALLLPAILSEKQGPLPAVAFLLFFTITIFVWLAWSSVNWFLSMASLFVVSEGRDTFGALAAAVDLCREQAGAVSAVGAWFGFVHVGIFFLASCIVMVPLALAPAVPAWFTLGTMLLITLAYFLVADFLYVGRLAAFLAIAQRPALPPPAISLPYASPVPLPIAPLVPPEASVDQNELILSDTASLSTQASTLGIQPHTGLDKGENMIADPSNAPPDSGDDNRSLS